MQHLLVHARRAVCVIGFIGTLFPAAHAAGAAALPVSAQQHYQLALEAQTARDHGRMMRLLREAAQAGDRSAQEMLGLALLGGPALYGPAVAADRCEAAKWAAMAAAQGSEAGRQQLRMLGRSRAGGLPACAE